MSERDEDKTVFLTTDGPPQADVVGVLREQAAGALERALGFIEQHGDALAKQRVYVLLEAEPTESLIACLAERQNEDGSFPALGVAASGAIGFEGLGALLPDGVLGSLEALGVLADAQALYADCVEPLAVYLGEVQGGDGSWGLVGEGPAEERLFATGMIAGFLGRTRVVRPIVLERAGEFLAPLWTPDLVEAGHWRERTAFAQFFTNVHHDLADEALQWCGRELERDFRSRRCDTLATMRVLLYCDAQALPGATLDIEELIEGLLSEQAGDGGFAELAGGGPGDRVTPTLDAMLGLLRLCRALPPE